MLLGQYEHSLDDKGRLTLPADYAGDLAAGVVMTYGIEKCIYLFPQAEFEKISDRVRKLDLTDTKARKLKRRLFTRAHAVQPDRQRRIIVPQWLRQHAGITDRVILAGMDTWVEIWSPAAWQQQDAEMEQALADENFFAGLAV